MCGLKARRFLSGLGENHNSIRGEEAGCRVTDDEYDIYARP